MADLIFAKQKDGVIKRLGTDRRIRLLVERNRQKFQDIKAVEAVYTRIGVIEPDPLVRDQIMTIFFVSPHFLRNFQWVNSISDELLAMLIKNLKDHIGYLLFPMAPEFDGYAEAIFGLGYGGALLRSLSLVPKDEYTYF